MVDDPGGAAPPRLVITTGRHDAPADGRDVEFSGDGHGTLALTPDGAGPCALFPFTVFGMGTGDRILFQGIGLLPDEDDVVFEEGGDGEGFLASTLFMGGGYQSLRLRLEGAYSTGQFRLAETGEGRDGRIGLAFERVASRDGTGGGDELWASVGGERLIGLGGSDVLIGGSGNDLLDGGPGVDTADYRRAESGVTVSLSLGRLAQAVGGGQGTDRLLSIENLNGSPFADTLSGDPGDNRLDGGAGADTLDPGLSGADVLIGGAGADTFVLRSGFENGSSVLVADFTRGSDRIGTAGLPGIRTAADIRALVADEAATGDAVLVFTTEGGWNGPVTRTVTLAGIDWRTLSPADFTRLGNTAPKVFAANVEVYENGAPDAAVVTIAAEDGEGDPLSFSVEGEDAGFFAVDAAGIVRFKAPPDFEARADKNGDNIFRITLVASDGMARGEKAVSVTVRDANDAPAIAGGAAARVSVPENVSGVVHQIRATDADAGSRLAFKLIGGADAERFTLDAATGALRFKTPPDYENPADAGRDNVYDLVAEVTDGRGGRAVQAIGVAVTDVGENRAPAFAGGAKLALAHREGAAPVVTPAASDPDGDRLTFAIAGGADAALFRLEAAGGAARLVFNAAPDFEKPLDAGRDNAYDVTLRASDGRGGTAEQAVAVRVLDVDEAPRLLAPLPDQSVAEDAAWRFMLPAGTFADPEGRAPRLSASLADGGALPFWLAFDAAARAFAGTPPANWNGVVALKVTATDAGGAVSDTFTLTVAPVNDAPRSTGPKAAMAAGREDTPYRVKAADLLAGFGDADGDKLSLAGLSAGAARVKSNGDGTYTLTPPADHAGPLALSYRVSDGKAEVAAGAVIAFAPVNDAPAILSHKGRTSASLSLKENETAVAKMEARDVDSRTLKWSISGADAKLFAISKTGALSFRSAPDFELPRDRGEDNTYAVVVKVSDGRLADTQALAVEVEDVKGRTLKGTARADKLSGTPEADRLEGREGRDTLKGSGGNDTFVFNTAIGPAGKNVDRIADFADGDRIELSRSVFAGLKAGRLDAGAFKDLSGAAADGSDRILYDKAAGRLFFDADGAGRAFERVLFAEIADKAALDAGDFWVV